ncbi:MAG: helix-turn-helix domain-containing protein, partial [Solobacterium sp.]|nr:helix-turn-helix domain-containing protein [Solobacterium sp.]
MSIRYTDLQIAQRIRDRREESLDHLAQHYKRSTSSIRRSISTLNNYLPYDHQIISDDRMVSLHMSYAEYIEFVRSLTTDDYIPDQNERIDLCLLHMFFCPYLNMSELYESLHFSMATRKTDSTVMKQKLDGMSLRLERVVRKGVRIEGDELKYRIYISQILSKLFDITPEGTLKPRQANSPLQTVYVQYMFQYAPNSIAEAARIIRHLQSSSGIRFSYNSARLLYAYTVCTVFRIGISRPLQKAEHLPAGVTDYSFFENEYENMTYNCLTASMETLDHVLPPAEEELAVITLDLISTVQKQILTWISDDSHLYEDVYSALHRFLYQQYFGFTDQDFMLDEINVRYHYLYEVLGNALQRYQETYGIRTTHAQ